MYYAYLLENPEVVLIADFITFRISHRPKKCDEPDSLSIPKLRVLTSRCQPDISLHIRPGDGKQKARNRQINQAWRWKSKSQKLATKYDPKTKPFAEQLEQRTQKLMRQQI